MSCSTSGNTLPSTQPLSRRGRRPATRVPCGECIARAIQNNITEDNQLCDLCIAVLSRPRQPLKKATSTGTIKRPNQISIATAPELHTDGPSLLWSTDKQEQHAVRFFMQHSTLQLSGYFNSPFWSDVVVDAARHEPSVMHAIAAIGTLHERILAGPRRSKESHDRTTRFALKQCNKSIHQIIKPAEGGRKGDDSRLMLTLCVLYTCFEALQGDYEQAFNHVSQGYKLLQQCIAKPGHKPWDASLIAVELDQLCVLMRWRKAHTDEDAGITRDVRPSATPISFDNIAEAHESLEGVLIRLTTLFLNLELDEQCYDLAIDCVGKHLAFAPWLESWEVAFSEMLARMQLTMTSSDRKAAMILKAHHLIGEVLANVNLSLGEYGWGTFHANFGAIVNLAEAVLEDTPKSDLAVIETRHKQNGGLISTPKPSPNFSLGIIDPLYEVVARCQDPALRQRALHLIAMLPRQDCIRSSWSARKIEKFLIRLEEEGIETQKAISPNVLLEEVRTKDRSNLQDNVDPTRPKTGHKRAILRESARKALNPGLFAWRASDPAERPTLQPAHESDRSHSWTSDLCTSELVQPSLDSGRPHSWTSGMHMSEPTGRRASVPVTHNPKSETEPPRRPDELNRFDQTILPANEMLLSRSPGQRRLSGPGHIS